MTHRRARNLIVATLLLATTLLTAGEARPEETRAQGARMEGLVVEDAAVEAGIYQITRSWSVNVHDFNGDTWPDVLLGLHGDGPARLYRNDSGSFTEVNAGVFYDSDRHDCAWADVNQDTFPDVYCTLGSDSGGGRGENQLWMQQPDRTFIDMAEEFGVLDEYGRGRHTVFLDVNHDAYPDLFVGNQYPRTDDIPSPNRLFINEAGSWFRDAPEYGLEFELGASCADTGDFNRDGWEDLLVCGQPEHGLLLYRNDQGESFTDVSESLGVTGPSNSAVLVDLNADGWLDVARVKGGGAQVQLQAGGGFGPPVMVLDDAPNTRWIAEGDVNRDSHPDLYVLRTCSSDLTTNSPDHMLLNRGTGLDFVETPIPQTTMGCGDVVEPIDYDRNGNVDFIVLNGIFQNPDYQPEGPVQLISFAGTNDVVPPTTTITSGPSDPTAETSATFTFSADENPVTFGCSLDGGATEPCTSPVTYRGLSPGPHTFSVAATDGSGNVGDAATWSWTIDDAVTVSVQDYSFSPRSPVAPRGGTVRWNFNGPSEHTASDNSGMGLFDSGPTGPGGSYQFTFVGAGKYTYGCTIHPLMTGSIRVPIEASPPTGSTSTTFDITWASQSAPLGYLYDVQIRRPGSGGWDRWMTGQTIEASSFVPDAGPGLYGFRARLRSETNGAFSRYSPAAFISVTS